MTDTHDICPDHPLFPGEPPPEAFFELFEILALTFVAVAALCWIAARTWPFFANGARVSARIACALVLMGLPFLLPFSRRNGEEWRSLQRAIQVREAALRDYQRDHPGWTKEQTARGFRAETTLSREHRFVDPNIRPVYFKVSDWRDDVPRIVVAYNACNNALFDSDTMWVEDSD